MPEIVHRAETGRTFDGIPMHAAIGVHEYALSCLERGVEPGARVVDVGAGSGALTARLLARGFDVIACDLDGDGFRGGTRFVAWDVADRSLPPELPSGSVDAVCAIEMLEHVKDPAGALRNLFAVLRPGGFLLLSTPNVTHPRSRVKYLLRGAPSYFGRSEFFESGHRTILPDWILELLVDEAGFVDRQVSYAGSMGLGGLQGAVYAIGSPVMRLLGWLPSPRVGDGCITFVQARKPG